MINVVGVMIVVVLSFGSCAAQAKADEVTLANLSSNTEVVSAAGVSGVLPISAQAVVGLEDNLGPAPLWLVYLGNGSWDIVAYVGSLGPQLLGELESTGFYPQTPFSIGPYTLTTDTTRIYDFVETVELDDVDFAVGSAQLSNCSEPSSIGMMLIGLIGCGMFAWRRKLLFA
jgi:hypothetical protein